MFQSLRHRNARIFFVGLLVSNVGSWLQFTATSVLLYRLTGKSTTTGLNAMFQFLPMLLIGPWAGGLSDKVDRRKLTLITQGAMGAQAILLGTLEIAGHISVGVVYLLSAILGVINAIDNPSRRGFVTELVEPEEIPNAVSLNTAVMTGSRIFGPALAALLLGPLGAGWLFVMNGISFIAILGALMLIDVGQLHKVEKASRGGKPVREAIAYVRGDAELWYSFLVFTIVSTFAFNYGVVLPKLSDVRWQSPGVYGWLLTVISLGSLIGSLATARRVVVTINWLFLNVLVNGLACIAIAWSPNVVVGFVLCVPLGAAGTAMVAAMNAITQQKSPAEMRSRMLALVAVAFLGSTPIGGPVTGWIGDHVSIEWALGYGGVVTLLCVPLLMKARAATRAELQPTS